MESIFVFNRIFRREPYTVRSGSCRLAVADLGGAPPPHGPKFLNFMQFFTKFGKIICWRPPGGLMPPPTGNPGSATD